ncbi:hypothetical protein [Chryseobacterium sp.]|uniref:hypothetical protein n=1 Tax=Chryseobacterium sp. TaxID=1871047 RepID=UPI00260BB74F|nr:hypothetical protein [Chryseobacterium sp.]
MKKIISILAVGLFAFGYAQEKPKEGGCCAGKDKKECAQSQHKDCNMKSKTAENAPEKDKKAAKVKKTA